jgi:eukaryotic-like serine/threonine-protein kinase
MSPEQVRGQMLDGRSDLFSLGVVLYELITGCRPFQGETSHHTMVAITDAEVSPIANHAPNSPALLQEIINKVLAKAPDERYQTARALLSDLEMLQAEVAGKARLERMGPEALRARRISQHETKLIARQRGTAEVKIMRPGYLKRRQLQFIVATVVLLTAAYFYFGRGPGSKPPVMTEKDTILLADFLNTTGDTDFDGTLKQGLTVQLGQSPYINIFPEERARETLALMGRSHDAKITREVGIEICQRRGIKVLMVGAIARLGRNYVITLEAVNSQDGEAVVRQQTEAEGKEQVLKALGRAVSELRQKLGESLASIRKFDVPIEQATTASLEAFKDFTVGIELRRKGQYAQAVPTLKRAIELDSEFARGTPEQPQNAAANVRLTRKQGERYAEILN